MNLEGKVAFVTGAASGMGRLLARNMATAGARIAALDLEAFEFPVDLGEPLEGVGEIGILEGLLIGDPRLPGRPEAILVGSRRWSRFEIASRDGRATI